MSPAIAGLGSFFTIPGLGQALARSFRKGLMLFVSLTSIVALWVWRDRIVARLETTFLGAVKKSIYLQPILSRCDWGRDLSICGVPTMHI